MFNNGIATDPSKIESVTSWPTPTTTKQVHQFLGLAGSIDGLSGIFLRLPILSIVALSKILFLKWISENQKGFKMTKTYLISAPVIAYTDFVHDRHQASDTGIGAVLSQLDESSRECVIAYASILLSKL